MIIRLSVLIITLDSPFKKMFNPDEIDVTFEEYFRRTQYHLNR